MQIVRTIGSLGDYVSDSTDPSASDTSVADMGIDDASYDVGASFSPASLVSSLGSPAPVTSWQNALLWGVGAVVVGAGAVFLYRKVF